MGINQELMTEKCLYSGRLGEILPKNGINDGITPRDRNITSRTGISPSLPDYRHILHLSVRNNPTFLTKTDGNDRKGGPPP